MAAKKTKKRVVKASARKAPGTKVTKRSATKVARKKPAAKKSVAQSAAAARKTGVAKKAARGTRLADEQLDQALVESARAGDTARLVTLLDDRRTRLDARLDAALLEAAREGQVEAARLLLDRGADPNAVGAHGSALSSGLHHAGLVRLLLERGASPDGPSPNGATVLHRAVELAMTDVAEALLAAGANPRREDDAGRTPLHVAAHRSLEARIPPAMIDLLIRFGARTESGSNRSTPLLWAVEDGQIEHVQRLLAHGADVNVVVAGKARKTALHVAFERGHDAIARVLVEHGADRSKRHVTGLDLATVYGPWGEDVRPLDVHYVPSVEPQRLEVKVAICALHPSHLGHFVRADFEASTWARLIEAGVAGGDLFPPEAGRASPSASIEHRDIGREGIYERTLALDVAAVAPQFLGVLARRLLDSPSTLTGAGAFAPLRVVALAIRGSREGETALDGNTLRRWVGGEAPRLLAYADALPFPLDVAPGREPSLRIVARPEAAGGADEAIVRHAEAWLAVQGTWRRMPDHDGVPVSLVARAFSRASPVIPLARFGSTGAGAKRFPYDVGAARATLANAMRALHARVPLEAVVLTVPGA